MDIGHGGLPLWGLGHLFAVPGARQAASARVEPDIAHRGRAGRARADRQLGVGPGRLEVARPALDQQLADQPAWRHARPRHSLDALHTLRTRDALRPSRSLQAWHGGGWSYRADRPLLALRPAGARHALLSLRPTLALRSWRALRPGRAWRAGQHLDLGSGGSDLQVSRGGGRDGQAHVTLTMPLAMVDRSPP